MKFFLKNMDREIEAYQQETAAAHYEEVEHMYRRMRGWMHDYRNHIQTMKAYAANGDLEAVVRYLDTGMRNTFGSLRWCFRISACLA